MPTGFLLSVVFYSGWAIQVAVGRNTEGRDNYSMIVVIPSRFSRNFDEQALEYIVAIAEGAK